MTNLLQRSIPKSWAMVAICATLACSGCGNAVHHRAPLLPEGMLFDEYPDSGYHQADYINASHTAEPIYDEPGYDEFIFDERSPHDVAPIAHGCPECGPGYPGPIRGLIHDLFHHLRPVARTVEFLFCDHCGGNALHCRCAPAEHVSTHHGPPTQTHAGHGLLGKPPIAVENHVGPCWGYYETAWRRFPPHCPNVPLPIIEKTPGVFPEEIGPGGVNDRPESSPDILPPGPQVLPAPLDGNGVDGFQAANPNRGKSWQTARSENPLRAETAAARTAWKPPQRMSWNPLRTADQRRWRKPNEEKTITR
ncbi:MAG: hypothetical protein MPJ50_10475 [Pirellulales bacterium]|nr:hypothetical protein [Pirellulales bacterium]